MSQTLLYASASSFNIAWRRISMALAVFLLVSATSALQADLLGLWQFDNGAEVGQATVGTDLTANGDAQFTASGQTGGGLLLDGAGDMLTGLQTLPTGDSSYTVAAWINADDGGSRGIVGWGNYGTSGQVNATRLQGTEDLVNYGWGAGNDIVRNTGVTWSTAGWTHVAATYDSGTSTKTLYVNGSQAGTTLIVPDLNVVNANFALGRTCHTCGGGEFFDGRLDDVAVFSSALNAAQLATIAGGDYSAYLPTLAHRYGFNSDANDQIGTAHLTLNGTASVSGGVLDLPGGSPRTNNAEAVGGSLTELANTINSASSISIEAWFNQDAATNWAKLMMAGNGTADNMDITPRRGSLGNVPSMQINDSSHAETTNIAGAFGMLSNDTDYYVAAVWSSFHDEMTLTIGPVGGALSTFTVGMAGQQLSDVPITQFFLGSAVTGFGDSDFNGQIDEFRIWNGVLSSTMIAESFAAGPNALNIVPEPSGFALAAIALVAGMLVLRRRCRFLRSL